MNTFKDAFAGSLDSLKSGFNYISDVLGGILPSLIVALVVLVIGSWIAVFVGNKLAELIRKGKIDAVCDKTIFFPLTYVLGVKVVASKLIGEVVKWVLLISVFISVFDILGMNQVIDFFGQVLNYLPVVFVATFIVVVGALLANFVAGLITVVTRGEHNYMASLAKLAINAFAAFIALVKMFSPVANVAGDFMQRMYITNMKSDILFAGVVVLFVLAFKDVVVSLLQDLCDDIKKARSKKGSKLDEIVKIS